MTDLRDPVSSASHLLTALWAVYATLVMWRFTAGRPGRLLPVVVYGVSMVLLYLASGTFHGLHYDSPEEKRFFQKLDQSAVYLLIAGTYTPVLAILLEGAWRKWFLRMVWLMRCRASRACGCSRRLRTRRQSVSISVWGGSRSSHCRSITGRWAGGP